MDSNKQPNTEGEVDEVLKNFTIAFECFFGDDDYKEEITQQSTKNNNNTNSNKKDNNTNTSGDICLSLKGVPEFNQYPFHMKKEKFYFMASIKAPYFRPNNRAPIDIVCVIDESGSMRGTRIQLVRETVQFIIKNLDSRDQFGCVAYASQSRVIIGLTEMDQQGKQKALEAVQTIEAGGHTALCDGLSRGIELIREKHRISNHTLEKIASVMLFTDGMANRGPATAEGIIEVINRPKQKNKPKNQYNSPHHLGEPMVSSSHIPGLPTIKQGEISPYYSQTFETPNALGSVSPLISNGNNYTYDCVEGEHTTEEPKLPCTINTFGFGSDHNCEMLQALAEHGDGMYTFIKNTDMISETFAECVGGLISTIAQNISIKIEALNNVKLIRCLNKGFNTFTPKINKEMIVNIPNIQSEESRDLIFELVLPRMTATENKFDSATGTYLKKISYLKKQPIVQLACKYQNMIKNKQENKSVVCGIERIAGNQVGERNIELDIQHNRLLTADAMLKAQRFSASGDIKSARSVLHSAQSRIASSPGFHQSYYCRDLVNDISECSSVLGTPVALPMLRMNSSSHYHQRSVQSMRYSSQSSYSNKSKRKILQLSMASSTK